MKIKMTFLIALLFISIKPSAFAQGGSKGGGGGDATAADFVKYARYAIQAMKEKESHFIQEESNRFETTLSTVQIFSGPNELFCYSDQRCEDAHYDAVKSEIWINKDTWKKLTCIKKMNLVLHEYGRAAELENATYAFSSKVFTSPSFRDLCVFVSDQERSEQQRANQTCH